MRTHTGFQRIRQRTRAVRHDRGSQPSSRNPTAGRRLRLWLRLTARHRLLVVLGVLAVLGIAPAAAQANLSWTNATTLYPYTSTQSNPMEQIACPSEAQCTAVTFDGDEVTFDPTSPASQSTLNIDQDSALTGVACPSLTQCTAVDQGVSAVTFDPTSSDSNAPVPTAVDISGDGLNGIACPSLSLCAAVDNNGAAVLFDPDTLAQSATQDLGDGGRALAAVACPTGAQCTAVDTIGNAITFDPATRAVQSAASVYNGSEEPLDAIACPSASQCTAVDGIGDEITFDPSQPNTTATLADIDGGTTLSGIACPSTSQCTAVDQAGNAITFDPNSPAEAMSAAIDAGNFLSGIACPSWTLCTAAEQGDSVFTGAFPVPAPTSPPPSIIGTAIAGQTLREAHGDWSNSPTGYTYQWEACDNAGNNCTPIAAATTQSYQLTASDVGHTIAVQETASNPGGSGSPATSSPTAIVVPVTPVVSSPPSITGDATVRHTLTEAHGRWSGSPTAYAYQWEDCNSAGSACSAIRGATRQSYELGAGDADHTIRVLEVASNAGGAGSPASSSPTAAVVSATVGHVNVAGGAVKVAVGCAGEADTRCKVTLTLIAVQTVKNGKVVATTAAKRKTKSKKPVGGKTTRKTVVLGNATVTLTAGHSKTVRITLDSAGRRLLGKAHRFGAKLTVTELIGAQGRVVATRTIAFRLRSETSEKHKQ